MKVLLVNGSLAYLFQITAGLPLPGQRFIEM